MDSFNFKGFWWLPNNPNEKLAGICSFTPFQGGELEIIGDFNCLTESNVADQPFIILGTTLKGNITLYDCFLKKKEKIHGLVEVSLYYINLIFLGNHFSSDFDVKFNQISIHYSFTINSELKKFERSEDEHLKILEEIMNQVPENHQKCLERKLINSNSLSLNGKIMSLLKSQSFQQIIKHLNKQENGFNIFLDGKSKNDFVNEIVNIRNKLSHGSGYDGDVYGKNFRVQIQRLKVLVEILLLKELGFDKETIGTIILRSADLSVRCFGGLGKCDR